MRRDTRAVVAFLMMLLLLTPAVSRGVAVKADGTQVVRLHYDYMVKTTGADPHSDAPDPAAIQEVVDAFQAHGIKLLIDPVHHAIPEKEYIVVSSSGSSGFTNCVGADIGLYDYSLGPNSTNTVNILDLKHQYFAQQDPNIHYAVFGWGVLGGPECVWGTGAAELPGADFAISAFFWLPRPPSIPPGGVLWYPWGEGAQGQKALTAQGGTFMHELGHNLGLHHGGGDDINYKPNYFSVMNYMWQIAGILSADTSGSTVIDPSLTRLDYSDKACPTLNELDLNESAGINCGGNDIAAFRPDPLTTSCPSLVLAPATGPVDWNCDGKIEPHVKAEINWMDAYKPGNNFIVDYYQNLTGFDDWAEVHACIASNCSFDASIPHVLSSDPFTGSPAPWNVTFYTSPSPSTLADYGVTSAPTITACHRELSDGESALCQPWFNATANEWDQGRFSHWSAKGGVSCVDYTANPTTCYATSPGTLTATYDSKVTLVSKVPGTVFWYGTGSLPLSCNQMAANGTAIYAEGWLDVCSSSDIPGVHFSGFTCSGALLCSGGSLHYPATAYVEGPGIIRANFIVQTITLESPLNGTTVTSYGSVTLTGQTTPGIYYKVFVSSSLSSLSSSPACSGVVDWTYTFHCYLGGASGPALQSGETYYWYAAVVTPDGSAILSESDIWSFTYVYDNSCPASGC